MRNEEFFERFYSYTTAEFEYERRLVGTSYETLDVRPGKKN